MLRLQRTIKVEKVKKNTRSAKKTKNGKQANVPTMSIKEMHRKSDDNRIAVSVSRKT